MPTLQELESIPNQFNKLGSSTPAYLVSLDRFRSHIDVTARAVLLSGFGHIPSVQRCAVYGSVDSLPGNIQFCGRSTWTQAAHLVSKTVRGSHTEQRRVAAVA